MWAAVDGVVDVVSALPKLLPDVVVWASHIFLFYLRILVVFVLGHIVYSEQIVWIYLGL